MPPAPAPRPVHVAAIGHCSALGLSAEAAAQALRADEDSNAQRTLHGEVWPWRPLPLAHDDWQARAQDAVTRVAAQLAAGLDGKHWTALPLFLASSSLQAGALETAARTAGRVELPEEAAAFAPVVARWLGLASTPWVFSTACTSGFAALDAASSMIAAGLIDEAVVLGFEFANDTTLAGFAGLGLLAGAPAASGLTLGEAVAGVRLSAAPGTGWRIAACRLGVDGHSPTAPAADGVAIAEVIAEAIAAAGLTPAQIDLLKPHRGNLDATDAAEARAIARVFGDAVPRTIDLKRRLGHTLGASGLVELSALLADLAATPSVAPVRRALLNLIGFGGGLAAVVIERDAPEWSR